jgi:hypothetical protein
MISKPSFYFDTGKNKSSKAKRRSREDSTPNVQALVTYIRGIFRIFSPKIKRGRNLRVCPA